MNNSFSFVRVQCDEEPVTVDQEFLDEQVRLEAIALFA